MQLYSLIDLCRTIVLVEAVVLSFAVLAFVGLLARAIKWWDNPTPENPK